MGTQYIVRYGVTRNVGEFSAKGPQQFARIEEIVSAAFTETEKEFASVHLAREKFAHEFAIHVTAAN